MPVPVPVPENDEQPEQRMDEDDVMNTFDHERLDVYRVSLEFLVLADTIAAALPRGRRYLVDQLRRASTSISLNIAEGAGEFSAADKARFYRIARRSATESAAILDACRLLSLSEAEALQPGRILLLRIVSMLVALTRGTGTGTGTGTDLDS